MATIERKPLPPPNSTAVPIAEADRAEIIARANPSQVESPPLNGEQQQADIQALEAKLTGSGDIGDAVALYKARKLNRR